MDFLAEKEEEVYERPDLSVSFFSWLYYMVVWVKRGEALTDAWLLTAEKRNDERAFSHSFASDEGVCTPIKMKRVLQTTFPPMQLQC